MRLYNVFVMPMLYWDMNRKNENLRPHCICYRNREKEPKEPNKIHLAR